MGDTENKEDFQPLGPRLKSLMQSSRVKKEKENFEQILINMASEGNPSAYFPDLRDYVPIMIQTGELFSWLEFNIIIAQGSIDQTTGAYVYTLIWDV